MAGLGDMFGASLATVNGGKPRNSDRIQAGQPINLRAAFEAAQNIPVAGDALSGGMALYDAAKGDYGSAAMNALGVLPFLSAGTIKAGKNGWRMAESPAGYVGGHSKDGVFKISSSQVDPAMRGKGEGQKLYRELIDDALAKGEKVTSDSTVEMSAVRVYEALKRKGYNVNELPRGTIAPDADILEGGYYGLKDSPVFEITNTPKLTEFEQRHLTAQKNAALPIEQGGLGLPVDNTAMQRADAMGFDERAAHFSRHGIDVNELDSGKFAIAPFDAVGTHVGSESAALERFNNTVGYKVNNPSYAHDELKGVTYPVLIKKGNQMLDESGNVLNELPISTRFSEKADYGNLKDSNAKLRAEVFGKYDSIPYVNDVESAGSVSHIVPPQNIRSRFAAFDPMRRHEADLLGNINPQLAGAMGVTGLGAAYGATQLPDEYKSAIANAFNGR